jgi:hypothetical protein
MSSLYRESYELDMQPLPVRYWASCGSVHHTGTLASNMIGPYNNNDITLWLKQQIIDSPTEPRTTEPRKTEPRKTQPRMD